MENRTYTVYKFDELPTQEAKDKAIAHERNSNDLPFMSDYMDELARNLLAEHKIHFDTLRVFYSLSNCQGDGVMFEMSGKWKNYFITVKHSGHYYHEHSKDTTITTRADNDAKEEIYKEFDAVYVTICKELEREGYNYIEQEQSDENIAETLRINEYNFTIDGLID